MNVTPQILFEAIKSQCNFLIAEGYEITIKEKGVTFIKHLQESSYLIEFGILEYSDLIVSGLSTKTIFNRIEIPISKACDKELEYSIYSLANPSESYNLDTKKTENNIHIKLSKPEDLNQFISYFESFYFNEILPFQNRYDTIKKVDDWLETTDYIVHSKLLNNGDGTFMLRKLMIMKHSDSKKFKGLYAQYDKHLKEKAQSGESPFSELYKSFKYLENNYINIHEA